MPNPCSCRPKRDCRRRPPYQDQFLVEFSGIRALPTPTCSTILNYQPPFAPALRANLNCPHPSLSRYVTHPTGDAPVARQSQQVTDAANGQSRCCDRSICIEGGCRVPLISAVTGWGLAEVESARKMRWGRGSPHKSGDK